MEANEGRTLARESTRDLGLDSLTARVHIPTIPALTEAASMLTRAANRQTGLSPERRAAYMDAATTLMDVALVAHQWEDKTGNVRRAR